MKRYTEGFRANIQNASTNTKSNEQRGRKNNTLIHMQNVYANTNKTKTFAKGIVYSVIFYRIAKASPIPVRKKKLLIHEIIFTHDNSSSSLFDLHSSEMRVVYHIKRY